MKQDSIIASITGFFIISAISIIGFFSLLIFFENGRVEHMEEKRVFRAIKTFHRFITHNYSYEMLQEQLKTLELEIVKGNAVKGLIPYRTNNKQILLEFYQYAEYKFIKATTARGKVFIFRVLGEERTKFPFLLTGLLAASIISVLSYLAVIRKLRPLKELERDLTHMGEGNLDVYTKVYGDDEISTVAKTFNKAIKNIKELKSSRDFFIRNIMHELKTPITKGKVTAELLEDDKNKERLKKVFNRLEVLINELASIESIISGKTEPQKKEYKIRDLIDGAMDLMFDEKELVLENIEKTLLVDYNQFSIVFKNLIDNAVKYSDDQKSIIRIAENRLEFANSGEKMEKPLSVYTKPFEKTKSDGFGLGLYIVDTILKSHGNKLQYKYKNGENIFFFNI